MKLRNQKTERNTQMADPAAFGRLMQLADSLDPQIEKFINHHITPLGFVRVKKSGIKADREICSDFETNYYGIEKQKIHISARVRDQQYQHTHDITIRAYIFDSQKADIEMDKISKGLGDWYYYGYYAPDADKTIFKYIIFSIPQSLRDICKAHQAKLEAYLKTTSQPDKDIWDFERKTGLKYNGGREMMLCVPMSAIWEHVKFSSGFTDDEVYGINEANILAGK